MIHASRYLYSAAWLNILAAEDERNPGATLNDILNAHYKQFGRNYFTR
jgi:phosphoglucomutase